MYHSRTWHDRVGKGALLMAIGMALYPFSDACFKYLMGIYSVQQTAFLRATMRLIPLTIAVFFQGGVRQVFWSEHPKKHGVRLLINFLYTYTFMYAYSIGSLTLIYTLGYTSPIFLFVLSIYFLKERVSIGQWLAIFSGLLGVIVVIGLEVSPWSWISLLVLLGAILGACNKMLMRQLAASEHTLAIAIYPNLMMMLVSMPFVIKSWVAMPWQHWCIFAVVGCLTAAGQYALAHALCYAQASTLAPIEYSTLLWVVGLDWFLWGVGPDLSTLLGALMIIGSNLYIIYSAKRNEVRV